MCTQVHAGSFIRKLINQIKKQIKHRPEKVGELYFKNYLPPRLCHLDHKISDGKAAINDGIGKTLVFILKRYDDAGDGAIEKLLDILFDHDMTPKYVASVLVTVTQTVAVKFPFIGPGGSLFKLPEPYMHDLGDKKVFFLLLVAIIDLFLNMLLANARYAEDYEQREKQWIDYIYFVFSPAPDTRH